MRRFVIFETSIMNLVPRVSGFKIVMKSCSVKRCKKKREKRARTGERQRQGHRPRSRVVRVLPVFLISPNPTILSESLARARSVKIVRSRDPLTRIESRDRIAVSVKRPVEVWGAIHSTKIQTGPTGKKGPPQKVDLFFRNFSGWTEPIH